MGNKIFAPKGTRDILPKEVKAWEMVEGKNQGNMFGF